MSNEKDWFAQYQEYKAKIIELNESQEELEEKINELKKQIHIEEILMKSELQQER